MQRAELDLLRSRLSVIAYAIVGVLLVLLGGFWHFQMAQTSYYVELSNNNRFKQIPLIAPRGRFLDREGRILVDNRPSYDVSYVREGSKHSVEETVAVFAPGLGMTSEEVLELIRKKRGEPKFRPIILKEDVGVADIAFVKARLMDYPEIRVESVPRRRYLFGELAAHALGYVGEVNTEELKREEFKQNKSGDLIGKTGLERVYNNILRGTDGYRRLVVDHLQRPKEVLGEEPSIPGNDVRTTIDLDLQRAAEEAFGDQIGAAIAIDPRTGEVLVMTSRPSFDPNIFATNVSQASVRALNVDKRKPFRNRAIQDKYSPGSVFKVFMTVAGIESQTLNHLDHVNCDGAEVIYGQTRHCWKRAGHGSITLYEALVHSCNIFFYNIGKKLDIDKIAFYAKQMGLGQNTGIDLPGEDPGLIPTRAWKANAYKTKNKAEQIWRDAETINVSIGQGQVSVTPIQVTWAMGGLMAGGQLKQPHLVTSQYLEKLGFKGKTVAESSYPVSTETLEVIKSALWGVVNAGGTGTKAAVPGFDVAGKTGTAQVVALSKHKTGEGTEDNAWFVGFAPHRNPEIVVGVFVEQGGHGGSASAPIAHAIFDTYYRKKTGQFNSTGSGQIAQLTPKP